LVVTGSTLFAVTESESVWCRSQCRYLDLFGKLQSMNVRRKRNPFRFLSIMFVIGTLSLFLTQSSVHSQNMVGGTGVIFWTPVYCWIGADTKASSTDNIAANTYICKIHIFDNDSIACIVTGYLPQFDSQFNVFKIARWAANCGGSTKEVMKRFKDTLRVILPREVARIHFASPESLGIDVAFFGFNGHTIPMSVVKMGLSKNKNQLSVVYSMDTSFGYAEKSHPVWFPIGEHDAIDSFHRRMRPDFWYQGEDNGIINLIKIQCATHPNDVSEPIQLLYWAYSGYKWYPSPKNCSDQ
jgi:hypothetical protein